MNRLDEARTASDKAQVKKLDSHYLRYFLYQLAFLQNDAVGMANQMEEAVGKPFEDSQLSAESETTAYSGRLRKPGNFPVVLKLQPSERTVNRRQPAMK